MSAYYSVDTSLGQDLGPVDIDSYETGEEAKQKIADAGGPPVELNDLYYDGTPIADDTSLDEQGVPQFEALRVEVRSGVVTYDMTEVITPPVDSGPNVAHLRNGDVLNQLVSPVSAGIAYELALYVRGVINWSVEFRTAGSAPVGGASSGTFVGADDPDLTQQSDVAMGDAGSAEAMITLVADGDAVFDLVSFRALPG